MLSRLLTRKEQWVLLAFAGAIVLGSLVLWLRPSTPPSAPTQTTAPTTTAVVYAAPPPSSIPAAPAVSIAPEPSANPEAPSIASIRVGIKGAIAHPGVYTLEGDVRVQDLLDEAGGTLNMADLENINLAAPLLDGTTLVVPRRMSGPPDPDAPSGLELNPPQYQLSAWEASATAETKTSPAPLSPSTGRINVNTASRDVLETLPGIGPKLADEIIRTRSAQPFRTVDDLDNVPGIGAKRLETLRPLVQVN